MIERVASWIDEQKNHVLYPPEASLSEIAWGFRELVCTTPPKIRRGFVIPNDGPMGINYPSWGPFRESPGNVSVPKSTFQIEI